MRRGFDQPVVERPSGPAGDNPSFDYAAAYEAAHVTLSGYTYTYAGNGTIAPELVHEGYAYIGIIFDPPKGATTVRPEIGGTDYGEIDLTKDSDEVIGGKFVQYFAFATESGEPLKRHRWSVYLTWTGPGVRSVTQCTVRRA